MSSVYLRLQSYKYQPGDIISGEAICYFRSPKEFRKIRIRLQGKEHTSWTKTETYYDSSEKKNKSRTVHCSGDNTFLHEDDIVRDQGILPSGEHVFPISFQLPDDIPCSFQCQYGYIKYTIKLTVDKPYSIDLENIKELKIVAPVRLENIASRMIRGCEMGDEKTICCWCCKGGNMEMQVSLPCRTFAVGYPGFVKVYILNMSNVNVDNLTVNMSQTRTFKTTHPDSDHKTDTEVVAASHKSGVGAHAENTYNISLHVPRSAVVPNFSRCQLFRCEHELEVTAHISGCHNNLRVATDVAVSHEPSPEMQPPDGIHEEPKSNAKRNKKNSWETIGTEEYAGDAPYIGQPMPMPMPPGSSNPSAPPLADAPSAPSKIDLADTFGTGQFTINGPPPPSYEEVARQHVREMRQTNN